MMIFRIKKRELKVLFFINNYFFTYIIFMRFTIPVGNLTPEEAKKVIAHLKKSYSWPHGRNWLRAEKIKELLQKIS